MHITKEPVILSGWYENTDGTWSLYRMADHCGMRLQRVVKDMFHIPRTGPNMRIDKPYDVAKHSDLYSHPGLPIR